MKYFMWLTILVVALGAWLWFRGREDLSSPTPIKEMPATAAVSGEVPLPAPTPSPASLSLAKDSSPPIHPTPVVVATIPKEPPPPASYVVDSLGVLRDAQGSIVMMGQEAAMLACKERGMRLPTIRELVTWGEQLLDKKERSGRTMLESIAALNPDGKREDFNTYYDSSGHGDSFPQADWGRKWFRSSSRRADSPAEYYSLGIGNGYVSGGENSDPEYRNLAVRCVPETAKPR